VRSGSKAVFFCSSSSNVTWRLNGNADLPSHMKLRTNRNENGNIYLHILEIYGVKIYNSGVFSCEGELNNGEYFYDRSYLVVTIHCKRPQIRKGRVSIARSRGRGQPGNVARYECNTGYRLEGNSVRECLAGGQWSGIEPLCELVQTSDIASPFQYHYLLYIFCIHFS